MLPLSCRQWMRMSLTRALLWGPALIELMKRPMPSACAPVSKWEENCRSTVRYKCRRDLGSQSRRTSLRQHAVNVRGRSSAAATTLPFAAEMSAGLNDRRSLSRSTTLSQVSVGSAGKACTAGGMVMTR